MHSRPLYLLIIAWAFSPCKTSQPTTKEPGSRGPALSGTGPGVNVLATGISLALKICRNFNTMF